jgi:hypothetical protein
MADKIDMTKFREIGRNVHWMKQGDTVFFAVKIDAASVKTAPASKSLKNKTVGTTGGLAIIPGSDQRVNLTLVAPLEQSAS